MTDPFTDLEINCRSQLSILEACRHNNPRDQIVFASTRQIYGRPQYLPVDESHPIAPVDVNGINKIAGEWYHLLYAEVYGLAGRAAPHEHLRAEDARARRAADVPRLVAPADPRRGELVIYGDGEQRRDFNYVDDAVRAFLLAAARAERRAGCTTSATSRQGGCRARRAADSCTTERLIPARALPRRSQGDRHRRLLRRLRRSGGARLEAGGRGLEEGLARTLAYYREHGDALLGRTMSVPFLDLSPRASRARGELDAATPRARRRALGPRRGGGGFETAFAECCGDARAVGVASGTDALALALRGRRRGPATR